MAQPPPADESLAARLDLRRCGRIDHVVVIGGYLLVQALGRMCEQVAVFMYGAALHRYAIPDGGKRLLQSGRPIDDEELRLSQTSLDQVVEDGAPGFGALTAHALDRKQHLLAIRAHPNDNKQRDCRGFAIKPDARDGAVEDQPHDRLRGQRTGVPGFPVTLYLPPDPTDDILANPVRKQRLERAAYAASISAGEVDRRNQGIGRKRSALIGPQHFAVPFRGLAVRRLQSSPRDVDRHLAEGARQRSCPMAVSVTNDGDPALVLTVRRLRTPPVARPLKCLIQLALDHRLDEAAHPIAHLLFNRIEPVVEKIHSRIGGWLQGLRLRDIALHGVVSCPTL